MSKIQVLIGMNIPQPDGTEIRLEPDGKIFSVRDGKASEIIGGSPEKYIPEAEIETLAEMNPPAIRIVEESQSANIADSEIQPRRLEEGEMLEKGELPEGATVVEVGSANIAETADDEDTIPDSEV
jgi:hypothetical protein